MIIWEGFKIVGLIISVAAFVFIAIAYAVFTAIEKVNKRKKKGR